MKLIELQNKFIDTIYEKSKPEVVAQIKDGKLSKEELIGIYRNNLYGTLKNSLKITYPETHKKIGEKKFSKKCENFIRKNRSRSGNLDDYGEGFANEIEWLGQKSYLAREVKPIDVEKLKKLSAEKLFDLKFKLHPSCFLHKNFVIYRQNLEIKTEKISRSEMNFLKGIKENLSLYEIYEKHNINIQNCLQKYLSNSVLSSFKLK